MARREDNIKALKIGVNLDRKAIVLDYSVPGGAFPSKRRRFMPVATAGAPSSFSQRGGGHRPQVIPTLTQGDVLGESASDIVRSLRSRHAKYLVR